MSQGIFCALLTRVSFMIWRHTKPNFLVISSVLPATLCVCVCLKLSALLVELCSIIHAWKVWGNLGGGFCPPHIITESYLLINKQIKKDKGSQLGILRRSPALVSNEWCAPTYCVPPTVWCVNKMISCVDLEIEIECCQLPITHQYTSFAICYFKRIVWK